MAGLTVIMLQKWLDSKLYKIYICLHVVMVSYITLELPTEQQEELETRADH